MIENVLCIISKATFGDYAVHDIQTNSAWISNPYGDDYAVVPADMVEGIQATRGYCDIELNEDGTEVVSFVAREIPKIEENGEIDFPKEPTTDEVLNALLGV